MTNGPSSCNSFIGFEISKPKQEIRLKEKPQHVTEFSDFFSD